jgi:hypothetical protein
VATNLCGNDAGLAVRSCCQWGHARSRPFQDTAFLVFRCWLVGCGIGSRNGRRDDIFSSLLVVVVMVVQRCVGRRLGCCGGLHPSTICATIIVVERTVAQHRNQSCYVASPNNRQQVVVVGRTDVLRSTNHRVYSPPFKSISDGRELVWVLGRSKKLSSRLRSEGLRIEVCGKTPID